MPLPSRSFGRKSASALASCFILKFGPVRSGGFPPVGIPSRLRKEPEMSSATVIRRSR